MATASAAVGTAAPVMISQTEDDGSGPAGGSPARMDPATERGVRVDASAARQAKPSRVERGKEGKSRLAGMGCAGTRPLANTRWTVSVGAGHVRHYAAL